MSLAERRAPSLRYPARAGCPSRAEEGSSCLSPLFVPAFPGIIPELGGPGQLTPQPPRGSGRTGGGPEVGRGQDLENRGVGSGRFDLLAARERSETLAAAPRP